MALAQININVKTAQGGKLVTLNSGVVSLASGNDGIAVASYGNKIVISSKTRKSLYEEAYDKLSLAPHVSRINGVASDAFGGFFIKGSGCWDWYYRDVSASGSNRIADGELVLNDLCSSCTGCERTLRMKKLAEYMKIAFNVLKDASLYDSDVVSTRKEYLEKHMLRISESCQSALTEEDMNKLSSIQAFGNRLLGEYLTLVHMWNYAVANANDSVNLDTAKDDPSALNVGVGATQPDCEENTRVSVSITIAQVSGQSGLSAFVPEPSADSLPYVVSHVSPTTVNIKTSTADKQATGVHRLMSAFYPYFNTELHTADASGVWRSTTIDEWDPSVLEKSTVPDGKGGDTVTYNGLKLRTAVVPATAPTKEDYIRSKSIPSTAVQGNNLWEISVLTEKTGVIETSKKETYYYTTPYVPVPSIEGLKDGLSLRRIIAP